MVPAIKGVGRARLRRLPLQLRRADREDAREQAHRRRLPGHQHLPHQPGRGRHRRLGAAAAQRPERDHRHRLDRLPAGVAARLAGTAEAARRLEGDDDDLDLRPPGDPGGRVGRLPANGSSSCCRARTSSTSRSPPTSASRPPASPPPTPPPPRRRRSASPAPPSPPPAPNRAPPRARSTKSCCRRCRRRPRCSRPTAPTATSPPSSTRSAPSPRATRRCSRRTST